MTILYVVSFNCVVIISLKCEICGKEVKDIQYLSRHLSQMHKGIDRKDYYDKYLKLETDGICECCGVQTKFISLVRGYEQICHQCDFNHKHTHICMFCGKEFYSRDRRSVCCSDKPCRDAYNRLVYANRLKECICSVCGSTYYATDKQRKDICKDCIKKTRNYTTLKTFEQTLGCKYCGKPIKTVTKHCTSKQANVINCLVCDECKAKNRKMSSDRMKLNNPTYDHPLTPEEYADKQAIKLYMESDEYKEHRKQRIHDYIVSNMKLNNPMYDESVRNKVSTTLRDKYSNGEIPKAFGKDHWRYKGNRALNAYIRLSLKDWRKAILADADYTCAICGKRGGKLHVHHMIPLRDIIDMGLHELHICKETMEFRDDDYQLLEKWVIDFHNSHDVGIVVCRDCHDDIDEKYHKPHIVEESNEADK